MVEVRDISMEEGSPSSSPLEEDMRKLVVKVNQANWSSADEKKAVLKEAKDTFLMHSGIFAAPNDYTFLQVNPKENIEDAFLCSLTHRIMQDPVITASNINFERIAIKAWMEEGFTRCPRTGDLLIDNSLRDNKALKQMIERWAKDKIPAKIIEDGRLILIENFEEMMHSTLSLKEKLLNDCPPQFLCPISGNLMINPVFASSGAIFEKRMLEAWIKAGFVKCPISGIPIKFDIFEPVPFLKNVISKWVTEKFSANMDIQDAKRSKFDRFWRKTEDIMPYVEKINSKLQFVQEDYKNACHVLVKNSLQWEFLMEAFDEFHHVNTPDMFVCPISGLRMSHPVLTSSGMTYDRMFIEALFTLGCFWCPATKELLQDLQLTPNLLCLKQLSVSDAGTKAPTLH